MISERQVQVGNRLVGDAQSVYVIAEIGINHNGSLETAKEMIQGAVRAGCDAVKFQKRTPELCVPKDQWNIERDTPWGRMTYMDYRHRVEFGEAEYRAIDLFCKELGIDWFASCWDEVSVEFMEPFEPPCYKLSSASLTDTALRSAVKATGRPMMISTGMSTQEEIDDAVAHLGTGKLLIAQSTSAYPCPVDNLNVRVVRSLRDRYPSVPIGYSGHETGLIPTCAAVALGANFIERHITLDRAMWGSDQAASVEIVGLERLVHNIRDVELSLGDGIKRVYDCEISSRNKLRRVKSSEAVPR